MRAWLRSPLFVALAAVAGFLGLGLMEAVEFVYWNTVYKAYSRPDPTGSVIVSLDGGEAQGTDQAIGSTAKQAHLLNLIRQHEPRHIYFDFPAAAGADPQGDADFVEATSAAGQNVTMVLRGRNASENSRSIVSPPRPMLAPSTDYAVSVSYVNFYGYAGGSPPAVDVDGRTYPSVAAHHSRAQTLDGPIIADFSIDPASVPLFDSAQVMSDGIGEGALARKTVFVTTTNPALTTSVGYFGHGRVPSAYADIAGIAGLAKGAPIVVGQLPFLLLVLGVVLLGRKVQRRKTKLALYLTVLVLLLALPAVLIELRIVAGNAWAIVALAAYAPARTWQRWRTRVERTHSGSGLPNIAALSADGVPTGYDVVAACVSHYEQMLASLPKELHGECARQIARRLSVASGDSKVYATDNGHFVWLEEPRLLGSQVEHFEGLKALFSTPLTIEGHTLDTNVHFGIDRNVDNASASRIQAALASATEAEAKGKLYEEFERQRLEQAPWELSLHARIEEGLRNGDIWLALQAQYDIRSGRIAGAEALIRWNDPERGAIPPDAFILQAERAGRIDMITYWVLERAIEASKALNAQHYPFQISVNLSARMVDQPTLVEHIAEIVTRHGFDCRLMTIEVTETFSMANREVGRTNLASLRDMGFRLSIDDFGNGQASLAYLAEIPSDEIKLDKRFVQAITTSRREHLIVRSVVELAHALGQKIVAEGVEDQATMLALRQMNCDIAQGFYIGRPVGFDEFAGSLQKGAIVSALYG
jgi:diguanylate cyclase